MSKLAIMPGSTSQILYLFIQDSSVTTGAGLTGLAYNTGSLTAYYVRPGGSATSITLATQTATGAYSSGGFVAVDGTNMPGVYRFDPPDAALASGVRSVLIMLKGAANMAPCLLEIDLNAQVNTTHVGGTLQTAGDIMADTNDIQSRLPAALVSGRMDVSVGAIAANAITAAATASDFGVEIAAAVWDRVITGANHNITNSAGKRLREITNSVVTSGTAQGGGTASITLASAASSTDGTYDPAIVRISAGTGLGQARLIIQYVGSTRVASVDRDWRVVPDSSSEYEIVASQNLISTNEGLATAGGANTITLNANASATTDAYRGQVVVLRTGTGQDQARLITAYNGTTKVATVGEAWSVNPASGTGYIIWPLGRALVAELTDAAISSIGAGGGLITSGTAAGIASGTITLASGHGISDTTVLVVLTGGTNADGKSRMATYSGTGDVFNVDPAWNATVNGNAETTPSGTITYEVYPYPAMPSTNVPAVDVTSLGGSAQSATDLKDFADAGYDPSTNKVQGVVLTDTVTTYTGNTPQTGDSFARIGATGSGLTSLPTLTQLNTTRYIKNTASQRVYFTLVDSTDHVTRETGITVTAQRSLDGASFGSATGTVTEVGNGVYYLSTTTADTNADDIVFRFTGTGCDPVELHVVTAS
jgi:hypothetical protein